MRIATMTIRMSIVLMILVGGVYHLAVLGVAQAVVPDKADGSLIYDQEGNVIGSELIGQAFTDPKYFHGRVSSIGYDAAGSGSPNYAPSNEEMLERTRTGVEEWKANNPSVPISEIPIDLLTNSGSGLDPHITPEAAKAQVPRISEITGIPTEELLEMIKENTEKPLFGIKAVNVLTLNVDLKDRIQ